MTPDELSAIERRANAATPGPWIFNHGPMGNRPDGCFSYQHGCGGNVWAGPPKPNHSWAAIAPNTLELADACFIAHSRTDVPKLTAEIRSLMAKNERLMAALKQINSMYAEADPLKYWAEVSEIARAALSCGGEGGG